MMTCCLIVICGIIFSSVDSDSDVAPHQEEPLKRLLKRTINHVKSFLGEFEKKIKRSRLLVDEIQSQSLINISTTNRNNLRTHEIPMKSTSFIRYPESPFMNRAFEIRPQSATGNKSNPVPSSPDIYNVDDVVRRVVSSIKYPEDLQRINTKSEPNIFFGQIETSLTRNQKPFTRAKSVTKEEVSSKPVLIDTDTNRGINANILLGAVEAIATTIHALPNRLMHQGPARFQSKEEYILHKQYLDMSSGGTANDSVRITKYPKSLIQPGTGIFQHQKELSLKPNKTKPVVMLKSFNFDKSSFPGIKYPNHLRRHSQIVYTIDDNSQITRGWKYLIRRLDTFENPISTKKNDAQNTKISTAFQNDKRIARINKQESKKDVIRKDYLSTDVETQEINKDTVLKSNFNEKKKSLTLSKSYYQLKQNLMFAPNLDYPDIFSRSVSRPAATVTRPARTGKQRMLFTTRSHLEFTSEIIPALAKDYENMDFRASNLYERTEPKKHQLKDKFNAVKPKRIIVQKLSAAINKMKNQKLRKIIAASSYSLSDEETYLKVKLLDQLYHYNKTLTT